MWQEGHHFESYRAVYAMQLCLYHRLERECASCYSNFFTVHDCLRHHTAPPTRLDRLRPQPPCPLAGRTVWWVQFVLNVEEGGEKLCCMATRVPEQFLSEMFNPQLLRVASEHGEHLRIRLARRAWRILRASLRSALAADGFAVGMALQRHLRWPAP